MKARSETDRTNTYSLRRSRRGFCQSRRHFLSEAIVWWKLKNKRKRALSKDDAKAVRMITKKAKK